MWILLHWCWHWRSLSSESNVPGKRSVKPPKQSNMENRWEMYGFVFWIISIALLTGEYITSNLLKCLPSWNRKHHETSTLRFPQKQTNRAKSLSFVVSFVQEVLGQLPLLAPFTGADGWIETHQTWGWRGSAFKKKLRWKNMKCVLNAVFFSCFFWYQKTGVHCLSQMLKDLQGHWPLQRFATCTWVDQVRWDRWLYDLRALVQELVNMGLTPWAWLLHFHKHGWWFTQTSSQNTVAC